MYLRLILITLILSLLNLRLSAQQDSLIKKLDSLTKKADTVVQVNNINPQAYNDITKITLKNYFVLLKSDFKQQISSPLRINSHNWSKVATIGTIIGGLMLVDKPVQEQAIAWRKNNPILTHTSKYITNTGGTYEAIALGAIGTYGYAFKNEKMKTTTLLASQAYITGGVLNTVIKSLVGRHRPSVFRIDSVEASPFIFKGPFSNAGKDENGKKLAASFPSAHATLAFAAATVYGMEYRDKPLIPILSYTAATLISLSRITENAHWTSDVAAGAIVGYLTGRQVVNNYHRYAKIKSTKPGNKKIRKNNLSIGMQNIGGQVSPALRFSIKP